MSEKNHCFIEEGLGCFIKCTLVWSRILSLLIALIMRHNMDLYCHIEVTSAL